MVEFYYWKVDEMSHKHNNMFADFEDGKNGKCICYYMKDIQITH